MCIRTVLFLFLCLGTSIAADQQQTDVIHLKNGSIIRGKITIRTDTMILIDLGFTKIPIPLTELSDDSKHAQTPNITQTVHQQPVQPPKLTQVRPARLNGGPINGGVIGVDAHFSEFGDYLQELINIVQIQWDRILESGGTSPKQGTHVLVSFRLNSNGEITEILKIEQDSGDYGKNAALNAIKDRAPYRPWTKEMIAALGDSQVLTFDFYYQ
jgi:hypothetical protein